MGSCISQPQHVVGGNPLEGSHDPPVSLANGFTQVALQTIYRLLLYYSIIIM